jgi:hypothetical protein
MMKQPIRANGGTKKWGIPFLLCICWLLSVSNATPTYGSDSRTQRTTEVRDSQFAIGNFDGDRQPDLATVEMVRFNPLHSRYWVSFRLSSGRLQTIGVTGPSEGLALLARDVNGDRALDLVLVTAWRHEFVAVLLNDGAGNFAAADPVQFRFNTVSSTSRVGIVPKRINEGTILAFQYSLTGDLDRDTWAGPNQQSKLGCPRSLELASILSQSSILGRAPPPSILQA